ncbi:MAG: hypothetical protein ACFFBD_03450 [Candidatus Hodarchaeota archaeon]
MEISVSEKIGVSDWVDAEIVKGSSEVTIEKEDQVVTKRFDPGVSSGTIVDDSLSVFSLQDFPPYVRDQIKYNIEKIEQYDNEHQDEKVTDEYSFGANFGIIKFGYKRTIEKKKK